MNISPAALVRSIGDDPPTLLLDEADTVFGPKAADNHEDLRGILNAGHSRNRPYIRWDIATRAPEHCPTFALAALAGIGDLPDTIADRAVRVKMRRRGPGEEVDRYRDRRDGAPLKRARRTPRRDGSAPTSTSSATPSPTCPSRTARPTRGNRCRPRRPRRRRLARPGTQSRDRAAAEDADTDTDASLGVRLLADLRDVFAELTVSFLPSTDLTARLRGVADGPMAGAWTCRCTSSRSCSSPTASGRARTTPGPPAATTPPTSPTHSGAT